jgi:hypothetical protein
MHWLDTARNMPTDQQLLYTPHDDVALSLCQEEHECSNRNSDQRQTEHDLRGLIRDQRLIRELRKRRDRLLQRRHGGRC